MPLLKNEGSDGLRNNNDILVLVRNILDKFVSVVPGEQTTGITVSMVALNSVGLWTVSSKASGVLY